MNDTVEFWKGDFGTAYTARNRVDWRARIPFWDSIIQKTGARTAYEVGANAGWNGSAIKHSSYGYNVNYRGCEINAIAETQAQLAGLKLDRQDAVSALFPFRDGLFDVVFTSGVLIHIAPDNLLETMQAIVDASCDYVLAVEYESEEETEVEYRGHSGKLWKRPYGKLYQDMGLTLVEEGDPGIAFDSCHYWLLRK